MAQSESEDPSISSKPRLGEPLIGTIFADRYKIEGIIGSGGMGKVYKAVHLLMKRTTAIKVVHTHLVASDITLTRFQQEAEAVSRLNHPNVVTVHDFGLIPTAYLVMDYLDGVSLADLLDFDAHLSVERSLTIFGQICSGLAHAHQTGVVHRDLKPSNIMLVNRNGQADFVKIVDFGIAKLKALDLGESAQLTRAGEVFGSPIYMSPEQCRALPMDGRSDIYSLGCIMYRTLTGRQPILGHEIIEYMYNHVNTAALPFYIACPELELPEALEAIIFKCLEKDPGQRFQSMQELKEALDAFASVKSVAASGSLPATADSAQPGAQQSVSQRNTPGASRPIKFSSDSGAQEILRAASAAESSRAASAAEAGFASNAAESSLAASYAETGRAASALESSRAASAAESERVAASTESARAISAADAGRAAAAAESARAASAAEAGRAASAAELERVASAAEAGFVASAAEAGFAAAAAEAQRVSHAAESGEITTPNEAISSAFAAEQGRPASAAEARRAASAAETARAMSASEAGLAAFATEAAYAASAQEAVLVATAHEARLAALAAESVRVASAAEARLAASAAESVLAASAAESGRAATAAESGRAANAAETSRAASAAEAGRAASAAEAIRHESEDEDE